MTTVTRKTITDDQIREMIAELIAERDELDARPTTVGDDARVAYRDSVRCNYVIRHCRIALGTRRASNGGSRKQSRDVCVAAWNARRGQA